MYDVIGFSVLSYFKGIFYWFRDVDKQIKILIEWVVFGYIVEKLFVKIDVSELLRR